MPIEFPCPFCGKKHTAPDDYLGKQVRCTKCQQRISVPIAIPPSSDKKESPSPSFDFSLPASTVNEPSQKESPQKSGREGSASAPPPLPPGYGAGSKAEMPSMRDAFEAIRGLNDRLNRTQETQRPVLRMVANLALWGILAGAVPYAAALVLSLLGALHEAAQSEQTTMGSFTYGERDVTQSILYIFGAVGFWTGVYLAYSAVLAFVWLASDQLSKR